MTIFAQNVYARWRTTQQTILKTVCQDIRNKKAIKASFHFSHYKSMETLSCYEHFCKVSALSPHIASEELIHCWDQSEIRYLE